MALFSDVKIGMTDDANYISRYRCQLLSEKDYYPFGMEMSTRSWVNETYRYGYGGKELDDEVTGGGNQLDFGERFFDPRVSRFLSVDPEMTIYPGSSPCVFVRDNPILRVDPTGKWDIEAHIFDRSKFGYGIAIVKDRFGKEVFRFKVRAEGTGAKGDVQKGSDPLKEDSNTPTGVYTIADQGTWISPVGIKAREAYGKNKRLALTGKSGQIIESGRSDIRIHGGRQEFWKDTDNDGKKELVPSDNPELKKTHGCLRAYNSDVRRLKEITDQVTAKDAEDKPGVLTVKEDLIAVQGKYYVNDDLDSWRKLDHALRIQYESIRDKAMKEYDKTSDSRKFLKVTDEAAAKMTDDQRKAAQDVVNKSIQEN